MQIPIASILLSLTSLLLSSCLHDQTSSHLPTAQIAYMPQTISTIALQLQNTSTVVPAIVLPTAVAPIIPTAQIASTPLEQYRLWIREARAQYPYAESVDTMWAVMLCESSGDPNITTNTYYGLFQYSSQTWFGDWNPYRTQPILDPQAQIFATAKAWHDGYQSWWGCYHI